MKRCRDCGRLWEEPGGDLCSECERVRKELAERYADAEPLGPADPDAQWELHPQAALLEAPAWMWALENDRAPLGSDLGADTFSAYRAWRPHHRVVSAIKFLRSFLRDLGVPDRDWKLLDPLALAKKFRRGTLAITTRDDVAIALAFSELALDGRVSRPVLQRALLAIERQSLPGVAKARGRDAAARAHDLRAMKDVLEKAPAG